MANVSLALDLVVLFATARNEGDPVLQHPIRDGQQQMAYCNNGFFVAEILLPAVIASMRDMVIDLRRLMRQKAKAPAPTMPHPAHPATERLASIAVLSFTDMSAAKDQDWFCDGIAEEILNALTPLPGLRVAARTSAFSFTGKSDDLRTIGEKLNVTTVLEGSVRPAGDHVHITAQLSDARNGYQLWSER